MTSWFKFFAVRYFLPRKRLLLQLIISRMRIPCLILLLQHLLGIGWVRVLLLWHLRHCILRKIAETGSTWVEFKTLCVCGSTGQTISSTASPVYSLQLLLKNPFVQGPGGFFFLNLGLTTPWSTVVSYCQILLFVRGTERLLSGPIEQMDENRGYRWLIQDPPPEGRLESVYGYVSVCLPAYSGHLSSPHPHYCMAL